MVETQRMAERRTLAVLTAIALLSFFLRIVYLDQKSLWWDESTTLNHIRHGFAFVFTSQMKWGDNLWLDNHPPLYFLFMFFFVQVAGTSDFAIRYPSAAWGVLLVVLLYTTGRKLINKQVGILAALLGALAPFYIWFSQSARMHILVPLLGLLAVYLLWHLLDGRRWPWHVAFVLANAALIYTNILGFAVVLFEGLTVVVHWLKHRDWRLVSTFAIVTLSSVPMLWFGLSRSGRRIREEMLPFSLMFKDVLSSYSTGLSLNAPNLQWYEWAFLALFVLGMLALIVRDKPMRTRRALFLAGYALVTFLVLYVVPAINLHYMGARYAIVGSPAFYLLLATGLEALYKKNRSVFALAFVLVVTVFGVSTYRYFSVAPYTLHRGHDYRSAAEFVNSNAYPNDAIVGSPYSFDAFYRYTDPGLPWYGLPRRPYWDVETFARETVPELEALKSRYDRIWFIDADYLYVEHNWGVTKNWLDENCVQFAAKPFAYVTVHGYLTRSPSLADWPEIETPLDLTFDDRLYVKGHELVNPRPQSGEKTRITLYLEARQDLDTDYGGAVRLRDRQGLVWASELKPILAGTHLTSRWRSGERYREWFDLSIPPGTPPGLYQIELGLYQIAPYRDLIAYTRENKAVGASVPLGEVEVQPRVHQLQAGAISPQRRLNARLGKEIDVLGLDASLAELEAGKIVPFVLYYQVHSSIDRDYVAQFLLLDHRGNTVWAQERDLVSPSYPTPHWQTGELLKGLHEFLVPPHVPAGHYRVAVRLMDREGNSYKVRRPRWNLWPGSRLALFDLDVRAREYSSDLPEISSPLQVGVGGWGELLGYHLDRDTLAGGEMLEFTLYWMAAQPVTEGYKVFVHIVGRDGHMGAQKDSVPASWSRPTYTWVPGEPIVDTHQVPLPEDIVPGQYDILIGLYDEKSGQRVMLHSQGSEPADHLTLSSLTLQ